MKTSITVTALWAAAACLVVSACSSSGSGSGSGAGAVAPTPSASHAALSAPGSAAGTGASGVSSCEKLTFADVQPLITDTVVDRKSTAITADGRGAQCEFDAKGTDSTGAITVQVLSGSLGTATFAQAVAGESKPVAVPGVGDKASRDTEDGAVNALKGDLFCSVSYSSSDEIPGVGPLEEAHGATNNIGENFYDAIAQAMGTLCNRIYGSGNTTPDLSSLLSADKTASPSDGGGLPTTFTVPTDGPTS
jgi:hypothetical protein